MSFHIELLAEQKLAPIARSAELDVYSEDVLSAADELTYLLSLQCRALALSDGVSFHVGGFGQNVWPVDVETDLAVAIEQVPQALAALRADESVFELNFFEQGIERYLTGRRHGTELLLECISTNPRWSPTPRIESMLVAPVVTMLSGLRKQYITCVQAVCPWLAELPPFRAWCSIA